MASLVREVTVGFQGPNKKIERVNTTVPADWITGTRDALVEVYENAQLRTRIAVERGTALWAEISDPFEPGPWIA